MLFKNFLPFLFFSSLLIMSCGDNGVSGDTSVSGRFISEDGGAIEGALVRVFAVKPSDTLVTRLRRDFKNVGCNISDATEFDHRFYGKPVAEGKTAADGKFSLAGLSGGTYHISITHPRYSWRYLYRSTGNTGDIQTKPVKEISGILSGNSVWEEAGQDYVVTGNTTQNGGSLTIRNGVRVRLGDQRKLTLQNASLVLQGNVDQPVWVTSDTDSNQNNYSAGMQLINSTMQIAGGIFSGATTGLICRNESQGEITNSIFHDNNIGLAVNQCSNTLTIKNTIAHHNSNSSFLIESSGTDITSCIAAYNASAGFRFQQNAKSTMNNSYASGEIAGVYLDTQCMVTIVNSELTGAKSGLTSSGGNTVNVNLSIAESAAIPVDIVRRLSGAEEKHTVTITKSNLYSNGTKGTISIDATADVIVDEVYFNKVSVETEYKKMIFVSNYFPIALTTTHIIFSPVPTAGLLH